MPIAHVVLSILHDTSHMCVDLSPGLGVSEIGIGKHSEAGREGGDLAKLIIECLLEVRKPAVVIHVALLRSVNAQ